MYKIWFITYY